jgi:hypothetical protein
MELFPHKSLLWNLQKFAVLAVAADKEQEVTHTTAEPALPCSSRISIRLRSRAQIDSRCDSRLERGFFVIGVHYP